jgi:hypothetical protein
MASSNPTHISSALAGLTIALRDITNALGSLSDSKQAEAAAPGRSIGPERCDSTLPTQSALARQSGCMQFANAAPRPKQQVNTDCRASSQQAPIPSAIDRSSNAGQRKQRRTRRRGGSLRTKPQLGASSTNPCVRAIKQMLNIQEHMSDTQVRLHPENHIHSANTHRRFTRALNFILSVLIYLLFFRGILCAHGRRW